MSVSVIVDNRQADSTLITFSDGAVNIWIDPISLGGAERFVSFTILPDTRVSEYTDIISLSSDILDDYTNANAELILNLPYFPNARADRAFERGMSSPLANICDIIIGSVFDRVVTKDVHNIQALGLMVEERDQLSCLKDVLGRLKIHNVNEYVICSPDKGAKEKAEKIANYYNSDLVVASKERDPSTGWIKNTTINKPQTVKNRDVLIVDDICDGGATFLKLAEKLRDSGAKSVMLYVTHGIFSKGLDIFNGVVDTILCNQIVMNYVTEEDINKFNGGK